MSTLVKPFHIGSTILTTKIISMHEMLIPYYKFSGKSVENELIIVTDMTYVKVLLDNIDRYPSERLFKIR